jgi:hypothetical protein
MRRLVLITAMVAASLGAQASEASAQGGRRSRAEPAVPAAYQPPPGMCRIWLDGVPASQQPAPTDCATAVRNRPATGRVLFGDDAASHGQKGGRRADRDGGAGRGGGADRGKDRSNSFRGGSDDSQDEGDAGRPMPLMSAATQYARGDRSGEAARWIGGQTLTVRASEMGHDGVPTRVLWLNGVGDVVQIWLDRDRDGRADRIETYKDGRRVGSVGQ